ncbi:nuclear transport factor 2 family protein [Leisingera methylohalidivorans]|uniref:Lumazine-binding protein n=1 Tax=Leisingera methylohalidivorans DSM 14336 TaxID=999552 RepID=V9VVY2_9RHOB|nr:nuclear transport factor 2 family protein [Leisingera methylohalidivorans]AHD02123.1 hypothetical protein METH_16890 [Leisingera methylohalidivorans DSM 14336]
MALDISHAPAGLTQAVTRYFDALYFCDTDLLQRVFHPAASLFDADDGRIFADPISCYHDTILRRSPPAALNAPREDEILFVDLLSDAAATVKVRVRIHNNRFSDHLMFAHDGSEWRIVAKLWHLDEVAADA